MRSLDDTIVAISTPLGESGIGIVRLSGPEAGEILRRLFTRPDAAGAELESHHLYHGHIVDPETGGTVDEVLASFMRAPRTYTRQDVAEIDCHGGSVPLRRVLGLALRQGARLAEPGEFTLRAFLQGRLDLAQAEAVLDVIRAKTEAGLRVAVGQLEGHLSGQVRAARAALLRVLAYLEATIDFHDDIPEQEIAPDLAAAEAALRALCAQADQGIIYRQGVRTAIVGRPNVGKSSLLNALLRTDRAIVTPIPGTTRDTLEETLNLRGIPLCLVDTAGIAPTEDPVERLGVARSRAALARADLALWVVDGSAPLAPADAEIAAALDPGRTIVVINKADLRLRAELVSLPQAPRAFVSALTGQGLAELESLIERLVLGGAASASDLPLVSNPRHQEILRRAHEHVQAAQRTHAAGLPADFVSIDLTAAVEALGEITGESASEDLLDTIFQQFCIGK